MLPENTFYADAAGLMRVALVAALAYVTLILLLRVTGKRTLSKMNAFDLVVTIALGSTLATTILSKDVALLEGAIAFAVLIGLQYLVTWTSVRSKRLESWVKSEPSLLFHDGAFLDRTMRKERVTEDEVRAAMRQAGHDDPQSVRSVVIETDSSLSVIAGDERVGR